MNKKLIKPLPPHQEHHTRQRSIDYSKELNKTLNRLLKEHQSTIGEKEVKDSVAKLQETVTSPTPTLKKKQTEGNSIRSRMELANQPHKAVSMRTVETDTIPREETKSFANSQTESNAIPEKKGTAAETDSVRSMERVNMLPKIGVKETNKDVDL